MSVEAPGLYLHLPFCSAICPYCDFSVLTGRAEQRRRFAADLIAELELVGEPWPPFETLYFGGGTPSLLQLEELGRIVEAVEKRFASAAPRHRFLEANPEDVTDEALSGWKQLGVTTVSLGIQSLDAENLRFLGRRHDPAQARRAVTRALAAGLETVSVDLMFGLPGQTRDSWRRDLEAAVELRPHHVSCYQLTVHEGTPFGVRRDQGTLEELDEAGQAELFLLTHELLGAEGYAAYEVSNFAAAPEHRSRHNQKHWRHAPYLGVGPSAHSFDGGARRWWNERSAPAWRRKVRSGTRPIAAREILSPDQLLLESVMLGLRTSRGVDLESLRLRFGVDLESANGGLLSTLEGDGLLERQGTSLRPTAAGLAVADGLAARFRFPEASQPAASIPFPREAS